MTARAFDPEVARHSVLAYASEVDDEGVGKYSALTIAFLTETNEPFVRKIIDGAPDMPKRRRSSDGRVFPSKFKVVRGEVPNKVAEWGVHPALQVIPELNDEQRQQLYDDMIVNGQQEPILVDREGRIVDGRARLQICTELDITPITKVVPDWEWREALVRNLPRMTERQRVVTLAKLPMPSRAERLDREKAKHAPLSVTDAVALARVGRTQVEHFKVVMREGIPALIELVEQDGVRVGTARRVCEKTPDEQRMIVSKIRMGVGKRRAVNGGPTPKVTNRSMQRDNVVTIGAIERLIASLEAMDMVIENASDGIDPAITSSEAGDLRARLVKARRATGRLVNLLQLRTENTA